MTLPASAIQRPLRQLNQALRRKLGLGPRPAAADLYWFVGDDGRLRSAQSRGRAKALLAECALEKMLQAPVDLGAGDLRVWADGIAERGRGLSYEAIHRAWPEMATDPRGLGWRPSELPGEKPQERRLKDADLQLHAADDFGGGERRARHAGRLLRRWAAILRRVRVGGEP